MQSWDFSAYWKNVSFKSSSSGGYIRHHTSKILINICRCSKEGGGRDRFHVYSKLKRDKNLYQVKQWWAIPVYNTQLKVDPKYKSHERLSPEQNGSTFAPVVRAGVHNFSNLRDQAIQEQKFSRRSQESMWNVHWPQSYEWTLPRTFLPVFVYVEHCSHKCLQRWTWGERGGSQTWVSFRGDGILVAVGNNVFIQVTVRNSRRTEQELGVVHAC